MTRDELAQANLDTLLDHPYFGRLVLAGISPNGEEALLMTAISGRSEGSRNRIYKHDGNGRIYTEVADQGKQVGDPELTLYNTQMEDQTRRLFAASNGRQTEDCLRSSSSLCRLLSDWDFEPDEPNFTPRISCRINIGGYIGGHTLDFAIHRRLPSGHCDLEVVSFAGCEAGFGYYLCTYESNGNPLPSFVGGPRVIQIVEQPLPWLIQGLRSFEFLAVVSLKRIPLDGGIPTVEIWNRL